MKSLPLKSWKTAMQAAGTGQQKGPDSSLWQCLTTCLITNTSKIEWIRLTKFRLIWHIYLTSCQPTTTTSSTLTTFCRENASTTSMRQKMLSKCLLIPKHGFLCYRNKQTYFSLVVVRCSILVVVQLLLTVMVPILTNKECLSLVKII